MSDTCVYCGKPAETTSIATNERMCIDCVFEDEYHNRKLTESQKPATKPVHSEPEQTSFI